jgi:hypothetical protein
VNQTAFFNGFIYAATNEFVELILTTKSYDFKQWEIVATVIGLALPLLNRS